jgi:hypothetical protein
MSYRDDRDADQARIDALELELARARDRIAELEGGSSSTWCAGSTARCRTSTSKTSSSGSAR